MLFHNILGTVILMTYLIKSTKRPKHILSGECGSIEPLQRQPKGIYQARA
jgi:hypothetical protein